MSIFRGLQGQLMIAFNGLILVILITLGIYRYYTDTVASESRAYNVVYNDIMMHKIHMENFLADIKSDLFFLKSTPPVQGILRAQINGGIDPVDQSTTEEWQKRLGVIFREFAASKKRYMEIGFVDAQGEELVRVHSVNGKVRVLESGQLNNRRSERYFSDALNLEDGQVYVSELGLNRKNQKVQIPYQPIIHYATVIVDENGTQAGVINLTIFADRLLNNLKSEGQDIRYLLLNSSGHYLVNPNVGKEWGFEVNNPQFTIHGDLPEFSSRILSQDGEFLSDVNGDVITSIPVAYGETNPRHCILAGVAARSLFFADQTLYFLFLFLFVLGSFILVAFVSYFITRSITRPMKKIIEGIGVVSGQVNSAANDLSLASKSLSEASGIQAASLEETSASLEEIASMTRQNADNVIQADKLADDARKSSEQGSEAMSRMVTSIQDIKDSADQSAKIINTIDEIAFQTNLLALNAAVEAARAGDAGKGFAVVAEEVRNLARRSADAAKDTSELVEENRQRAEQGVRVANDVNGLLQDFNKSIRKLGEIVREVAAASNEQAQGVDQVNAAMSQIDHVTQSNASNSDLTAASSEQLSAQAEQLNGLVADLAVLIDGKQALKVQVSSGGRSAMTRSDLPAQPQAAATAAPPGLMLPHKNQGSLRSKIESERGDPGDYLPQNLRRLVDSDFVDME